MNKNPELLLLRVFSILFLIIQTLLVNKGIVWISLMVLLSIFINGNLRLFYLKKDISKYISIIVEIIVAFILHRFSGGVLALYFVGTLIDIATLDRKYINYLLTIVIYLGSINSAFHESDYGILVLIMITALIVLLNCMARLYKTKVEAQTLYDRLRVSEEKLKEANEELEVYASTIEELAVLKERNRISREIHDSVGHTLSTAMIQLSAMERIGEKEGSSLGEMAKNLREFISESFSDVKRAVTALKPEEYTNVEGIIKISEVCRNFEKLSGVKVRMNISESRWSLSGRQSQNIYRITQEILSNSLRHGKATEVNIIINFMPREVVFSFKDNGIGTEKVVESGLGLKSIRERVRELNGSVNMESEKDRGFFVKFVVPREEV